MAPTLTVPTPDGRALDVWLAGPGGWLAANVGGACPHLSPDGGHLSLVVERFGAILDELIAGPA
jgi:hypothetical protein